MGVTAPAAENEVSSCTRWADIALFQRARRPGQGGDLRLGLRPRSPITFNGYAKSDFFLHPAKVGNFWRLSVELTASRAMV